MVATACGDPVDDGNAGATSSTAAAASGSGPAVTVVEYGDEPLQTVTLRLPAGAGPHRVVVLVHGGFWQSGFRAELMEPLARDLVARGVATWNIEYRAVGDPGGGYPGTLRDVAAAIDALAEVAAPLRLDDVTVVGHSAGGHLALWSAGRDALAPGDPGASPRVVPGTVVAQAPVADLAAAAADGLGGGAVLSLLGGAPDEVPGRYRVAGPGPTSARVIAVHGGGDRIVPPSQSEGIEGAELLVDPDADHFDVIDPGHPLWALTIDTLGL